MKIDIKCQVALTMEDRRSKWTSYLQQPQALVLVELEFCRREREGNLIIPDNQPSRIFNIDGARLSLNRASKGCCGGRRAVQFFDPNLPMAFNRTLKLSITITLIMGSRAAGEAIPHFQFPSKAKNNNGRINTDWLLHMTSVRSKFGNLFDKF